MRSRKRRKGNWRTSIPTDPRRCYAHRLSLGTHRALRGARLRRGNSAHALVLAREEGVYSRESVGRRIKVRGRQALRYRVERPEGGALRGLRSRSSSLNAGQDVPAGTVTRAKATCPCCGAVLPPERVRAQLSAERGGADAIFDEDGNRIAGARMTAVVTLRPDERGTPLSPANGCGLRGGLRKAQKRSDGDSRRVGTAQRPARALPGAGRADACRRRIRGRSCIQCALDATGCKDVA